MTTTKYSISAAHRITGKSRTTITKHLASGKLSCEEDAQGNKLIDASELIRVYGNDCDFSQEEGESTSFSSIRKGVEQPVQPALSSLKAQLEKEIAERERERAHTRQQIEHLQETLTLAQEAQNKAMLLLEHRTIGGGDWEKAFKALETRIAKQETTAARMAELKMAAKREAIEEIKSKAWWQVVFDLKGE